MKLNSYKSTSSGLLDNLFGISFLVFAIIWFIHNHFEHFLVTSFVSFIGIIITLRLFYNYWTKTCTIKFNENEVFVFYKHLNKEEIIKYSNIIELKYYELTNNLYSYSSKNRIGVVVMKNMKTKRIVFESKFDDNYLDFVKWIKSKNDKINFTTSSSDSLMNEKLQEEFGWNYRK